MDWGYLVKGDRSRSRIAALCALGINGYASANAVEDGVCGNEKGTRNWGIM